MIKNRFKEGDCIFWISNINRKYVFRIIEIYEGINWHDDCSKSLFHKFVIIYGDKESVSTREFQDGSNVYKTAKLLPNDWDDTDLLALIL